MKLLFPPLVLLTLLRFAYVDAHHNSDTVQEKWNSFKFEHNKKYGGTVEESYRFKIFTKNFEKIHRHNQRYECGCVSYRMDVNEFTDMMEHEVIQSRCGFNGTQLTFEERVYFLPADNKDVPKEIDWVKLGAVTKVKNQGNCGSCWAFSTTGSLEAQAFRHTNNLVSLSEQNLIDCSGKYGNKGCHNGMMNAALQYVKDNNGIDTEESYPYEGIDGKQCRYNPGNKGATEKGYIQLPPFQEELLEYTVATIGPISVAIEAQLSFFSYSEGIYYNSMCSTSPQNVNHAVLIVGYGEENGEKYWLVKNSWGENWGMQGYIKMAKNKENNCNIATFPLYPIM